MTTPKPFVFSIRPEYVARILDGSKRWEFRKSMPRFTMGDPGLIYESRGRGRIVASFTVGSMVHAMTPARLWQTVGTMDPGSQGIGRVELAEYLRARGTGVAFGLDAVVPLDIELEQCPPQSWARWQGEWPL